MGQAAALLLVRQPGGPAAIWRASLILALTALAGCAPPNDLVDPADHDAFFVWAGVSPSSVLERARAVYLLAGEVRRDGGYVPLRADPRVRHAEVWMVVRAQRIDWSPALEQRLIHDLDRWAVRNRLAGLQIDFDASTRHLDSYGAFLAGLRARLPQRYRLSVTGLMDWSANADPAALTGLRGVVDEIVVQSYQGRHTIPGYSAYLKRMTRLPVPFRVAIVERGQWREPGWLRSAANYRGTVVFLLPRPRR